MFEPRQRKLCEPHKIVLAIIGNIYMCVTRMSEDLQNQLDDDFKEIGEFGKYQFVILVLVGLMACQTAVLDYAYVFISGTPQHR